MGIKLKNKTVYIIIFIIAIYSASIGLLCAGNAINDKEYIEQDFFHSDDFRGDFENAIYNIVILNTALKDYPKMSLEEKVNKAEFQHMKEENERVLRYKIEDVKNKYESDIRNAGMKNNSDMVKILIEERNKKLEEVKKEKSKTDEEIKNEIAKKFDDKYKDIKFQVERRKYVEYYLKDITNGEVYTNIKNISETELSEYVKKDTLFTIKLPKEKNAKVDFSQINYDYKNFEGYIIVTKKNYENNTLWQWYEGYNYVRNRAIKNGVIAILLLILSAAMFVFIRKNKFKNASFLNREIKLYKKIPLDIRIGVFILLVFIMRYYILLNLSDSFLENLLSLKPYGMISMIALYILYFIFSVNGGIKLVKDKKELSMEWKKSLICKIVEIFRESFIFKNVFFKVITAIVMFCIVFPIVTFLLITNNNASDTVQPIIIVCAYVISYSILLPFYILRKIGYLNKITKATEAIVAGNYQCDIEEKGKGVLKALAHNINNMNSGVKKSFEEQMKSERMKSELITNVSHDLKTPLTSIINYIDLLKKEDISQEERDGYIEILDRKSQRLKVLIEDLFEASKVTSGAVELKVEKVDVTALLRQAMGEYDEKIKKSSLSFKVNLPEHNVHLDLDGKKTWRVFENLIGNILKYSQPNTRVYIDLIEEDTKVKVIMKNISAYEMDFHVEEIYERFKRGDKSRHTEGSGLGLAISKSIVELQGGTLNIEIDGDLFKVIVEFNK